MKQTIVRGRLQFEDEQGRLFHPLESVASWSYWSSEMVLRFATKRNRKKDSIIYEGQTLYTDEFLYEVMKVATDSFIATIKYNMERSGGHIIF